MIRRDRRRRGDDTRLGMAGAIYGHEASLGELTPNMSPLGPSSNPGVRETGQLMDMCTAAWAHRPAENELQHQPSQSEASGRNRAERRRCEVTRGG